MKKVSKSHLLALFAAWMITFAGCKKDVEIFTVTTTAVSTMTETTAIAGGDVSASGGVDVTARGICWSTAHNPTTDGNKTVDGTGSGSFTGSITGLAPNTTYFIRAYAICSAGTAYGNEISFNSHDIPASVTTSAVSSITSVSAFSGGTLLHIQSDLILGSGICWSTSPDPTINDSHTLNETGEINFTCNLTGLKPGTTYYVRAYAIYSAGAAYGGQFSFVTESAMGSNGIQKAGFPGVSNYGAASFSIGTKAYIGMGYDNDDNTTKEFWEWDQTANSWTRKADFPGSRQGRFVCFSISTKGYVETGSTYYADINLIIPNEFWEYDPETNAWTQKATIPVTPGRNSNVGFSIGDKGYIGLGVKAEGQFNSYFQDFWEYDPGTNGWTLKADFEGNLRTRAVGFSVGNKGYIGTGGDGTDSSKEFWEWDQATNVWTRKADFGGMARFDAVGFSVGNKGYIGLGNFSVGSTSTIYNDIWEWDQTADTWIQKADFRGIARSGAIGFSVGSKGYIGLGNNGTNYFSDFWEYDPNLK